MADNEFNIVLGMILVIGFIIGATMIYERNQEEIFTGTSFVNSSEFKLKIETIPTDCSEYFNYNATERSYQEHEFDTIIMLACILTELHEDSPNKTDEVLKKYNIQVMYDEFKFKEAKE